MGPLVSPANVSEELRTRLVRFACAFGWVDGGPQPQVWKLVNRLADQLGVPSEVRLKIREWMTVRPAHDELRIETLPPEHLRLFLAVSRLVADADGRRNEAEERALRWLTRSILKLERAAAAKVTEAA